MPRFQFTMSVCNNSRWTFKAVKLSLDQGTWFLTLKQMFLTGKSWNVIVSYEWRITESELLCPHLTRTQAKTRPLITQTHQKSIKCLFFPSTIHLKQWSCLCFYSVVFQKQKYFSKIFYRFFFYTKNMVPNEHKWKHNAIIYVFIHVFLLCFTGFF